MKTIIMIHGWDPLMYNRVSLKTGVKDPWYHRRELVNDLSNIYKVLFYYVPGFCGRPEPKADFWDLNDFSKDFNNWLLEKKIEPDFVLGYSFGGAIALSWKLLFKKQTKLILVSSALLRKSTTRSSLGGTFGFIYNIPLIGKMIKHLYLMGVNKYYRQGTKFLRKSYDSIVREDLSSKVLELSTDSALFIYGDSDTETPWSSVSEIVELSKNPYLVIKNSDHGIGQTHPQQIIEAILSFSNLN